MRVLITSAFIDPEAVGEPRWCYDLAKGLADRVDTVIIAQTPMKYKGTIKSLFPQSTVYEFPGWKLDFLDRRIKALIKPNYLKFHRFAKGVIRDRLDLAQIDCGHHFGPLGMRYPTPLRNTGIPYIVGPVGGSLAFPQGFSMRSTKDPWYYKLRDLDRLRFRYDPALRASYQNAEYLVGAAAYVQQVLHDMKLKRFITHSQRIAPPSVADIDAVIAARAASTKPLRLLIAARLIYSKGVQFVLRALAKIRDHLPEWQLDILGDGVYEAELRRMTEELGLSNHVIFHGHTPRAEVDTYYRHADIFLFPTIREPSGTVTFECMSWGLPIIAADYGGPATHVKEEYGIKVPVECPESFVEGIATAIDALAKSRQKRAEMGRAALAAARQNHSIDEMVDFFTALYQEIGRPRAKT